MIDPKQKQKAMQLLGANLLNESLQSMIQHSLEAAVQAGVNEDFERLNQELRDILDYLGTSRLDEELQKNLLEKLGIVVKQLCPNSIYIKKISKYMFHWNSWTSEKPKINEIKKSMFMW